MKKQHQHNRRGFTIIEVVLVLAIAGLIFMMVFIALPSLQRSQRDTQRRHDIDRVLSAVQNYQTNNRNAVPDLSGAAGNTFITNYLTANGADTFKDPDGVAYGFNPTEGVPASIPAWDETASVHPIYWQRKAACGDTEGTFKGGLGASKMAFMYKLEGSGIICVNN